MAGGYTRLQGGRWSDSRALSCVERFDTFNQYWTTVSSLHQARSGLGVAVLEGMIYVVGGETAEAVLCLCSSPKINEPQRSSVWIELLLFFRQGRKTQWFLTAQRGTTQWPSSGPLWPLSTFLAVELASAPATELCMHLVNATVTQAPCWPKYIQHKLVV